MSKNEKVNEKITMRSLDFAKWYDDVIANAELARYGKVKGTVIFTPNSTYIWESIRNKLDLLFKKMGVKNVILPALIPYSSFSLEKQHLEGFAPEMFLITKKSINSEEMADPLVLRPTSEILFCFYFKEILVSYSQLPIKFNQWGNVFRVEKNTRPFLRTSEFLWHEMHTLHISSDDALNYVEQVHHNYVNFIENYLDIPVLQGRKTENEKFAGAEQTFTCEALMQDGQALQCATTHYLAQNFSKPYSITFRDNNNELQYPFQTSAGLSTRIIGAIIMVHSDDLGLVLPWNIAINQIAILTLNHDDEIKDYVSIINEKLTDYKIEVDNSNKTMGYKIKAQQVLGTPITLIIGKKEVETKTVTVIFRDKNVKEEISLKNFLQNIVELSKQYDKRLYDTAKQRLNASIEVCYSLEEVKQAIANKHIALAPWGGNSNDEEIFKKTTSISPRCIKSEIHDQSIKCFFTNNEAKEWVYFAKSY